MEPQQRPAGAPLVALGDGSTLGDVTIGDVALGSIVKLTINVTLPPGGGLGELERLLDFQRQRFDTPLTSLSAAPLGALLARGAKQVDGLLRAAGVDLRVDMPAGSAPALVDLPLAARALAGLLENAVRQTPPGGTVLLRAALLYDGGRAFHAVEVRDFGRGLHPEDLARILAPGHPGPRRPCAGLGIPFAQFAAEAHGGQLRAASTPGHGSAFTLTFPAAS